MKLVQNSRAGVLLPLLVSLLVVSTPFARGQSQTAQAWVHAVHGSATWFVGGAWQPLPENSTLTPGATIKTASDATVDLILLDSGTVLRLVPGSAVRFDRLDQMPAAETPVTSTRLTLLSGALLGSQRKLAAPSEFEVRLPKGVARIVGTEYLVRADGVVTCLSGEVAVTPNLTGNGSDKIIVGAGFSYDPSSGHIAATTAAQLKNIFADVQAVRDNCQTFKIGRGFKVEDHCGDHISPICPGHGHDDDHGDGHGDGHGGDGHGGDGHGGDGHGGDGHGGNDGHGNQDHR